MSSNKSLNGLEIPSLAWFLISINPVIEIDKKAYNY